MRKNKKIINYKNSPHKKSLPHRLVVPKHHPSPQHQHHAMVPRGVYTWDGSADHNTRMNNKESSSQPHPHMENALKSRYYTSSDGSDSEDSTAYDEAEVYRNSYDESSTMNCSESGESTTPQQFLHIQPAMEALRHHHHQLPPPQQQHSPYTRASVTSVEESCSCCSDGSTSITSSDGSYSSADDDNDSITCCDGDGEDCYQGRYTSDQVANMCNRNDLVYLQQPQRTVSFAKK
uniref:Uncharacterized protein n=1 Tax=Lygus hesperus TaxID=30085 RepID=A0A0A9X1I3_LYGHE